MVSPVSLAVIRLTIQHRLMWLDSRADIGMVKQLSAPAGSAIIFTEALTHGTLPWKGVQQRRSILYKYSPGPMASCERAVDEDLGARLQKFTPQQQSLLKPPYSPRRFSVSL